MESKTKFKVTPEVIQILVNKHFPNEDICSVKELTEGMFNSAYAVRGTGIMKDSIVLKIGPASGTEFLTYEQEILRTEVEVYRLLEAEYLRGITRTRKFPVITFSWSVLRACFGKTA